MKRAISAVLLFAGVLLAGPAVSSDALAHEFKLGDLMIDQPWARASIGQAKAGAAYLTLYNHGEAPDRLLAVDSSVAKRTEIHTMEMVEGVMKMRPIKAIEVAPGEPSVLAPGGMHIMLMGLKKPLVEGESFSLTLAFEKAGTIEVEVTIDSATKTDHGDGMKHEGHEMKKEPAS